MRLTYSKIRQFDKMPDPFYNRLATYVMVVGKVLRGEASTASIFLGEKETKPNKFTIAMGELIRNAREEASLSQTELAEQVNRRRVIIADLESGKHEADASTLAFLVVVLDKPILYFYPMFIRTEIKTDSLSPEEKELIIQFRYIWDENLQRVAIKQVKALSEFDPKETLLDALDFAKDEFEVKKQLEEYFDKKKNRR